MCGCPPFVEEDLLPALLTPFFAVSGLALVFLPNFSGLILGLPASASFRVQLWQTNVNPSASA